MPARVWLATAGVAVGITTQHRISGVTVLTLAVAAGAMLALRRRTIATVAATFVLAGAGGWIAAALDEAEGAELRARAELFPRCRIEGRVLEQAGGLGTLLAVEASDCAPGATGTVIVSFLDLAAGTRISANGWLGPLGDDVFERARARAGADAELLVEDMVDSDVRGRMHAAADSFRRSLRTAVGHLDADSQGLILGMAIGDTSQLRRSTIEELRRSGLTHLLAVSGSNVAIVMGTVAVALRGLSLSARVASAGAALAFYILVVGPEPSVLRAGAMGAIALGALWRGVQTRPLNLLGLALVVVLLLRPGLVYAPGLHLSAAATAGIVVWANGLADRFAKLPRPLALALGATLAAQFAVSPVLLATFGEISLVAPVANVLAFPAVAPITVLALAAGVVSLVAPGPARVLMSFVSPLAGWVVEVGRTAGTVPWSSVTIPTWSAGPAAAIVILAAWRTLRRRREGPVPGARDDGSMGDWLWKLNGGDGKELRATETFDSKEEAEAWLGGEWRLLADEGADSVTLVHGERVVYTMGLGEE